MRKSGTGKINPNVKAWAESVDADDLFISVITLSEIEVGVLSMERKDAEQGAILREWLEHYINVQFRGRVLDVTSSVAIQFARMNVLDKVPVMDGLIASTAISNNMLVVSLNPPPMAVDFYFAVIGDYIGVDCNNRQITR